MARPRDRRVDEAVRVAVRELLLTEGYQATTVQAVARRAGVSPPSIYRRWSNQADMVQDVIFPDVPAELPGATDDLRADIEVWLYLLLDTLTESAARVALPGLLTEYQRDPAAYDRLVDRTEVPVRQAFRTMLAAHVAAGRASPEASADVLFDLVLGVELVATLIPGRRDVDQLLEQAASTIAAAATSRGPSG